MIDGVRDMRFRTHPVRLNGIAWSVVLRKHPDTQVEMQIGKSRHIAPAEFAADIDFAGQVDNQDHESTPVGYFSQQGLVRLEPVDHLHNFGEGCATPRA
jgi:hypothetical protein